MTIVHDVVPIVCHAVGARAVSMDRRSPLQRASPWSEVTLTTPAQRGLARRLVTTEMGATRGPIEASAAAGRVFEKLSQRLALLITPVGSHALLTRAVHLSRAQFPFLAGVQLLPDTDPLLERLRTTAANVESVQAHEGQLSVLATLVSLLDSFIGDDLTRRLLHEVWPELALK